MNDSEIQNLRELAWRRPLNAQEQARLDAWCQAHPERGADLAEEIALSRVLQETGQVQPSSNFTSRVLQAVERESRAPRSKPLWLRRWLPRLAFACLVAGLVSFNFHQHRVSARAEMAESVATVSDQISGLRPEWLQDFEAINRLSQSDDELLALLK